MKVRILHAGILLFAPAGIALAQPLTPNEAKAAVQQAVSSPEQLPGCYRQVTEHKSTRLTRRTITYTRREADGRKWERREHMTFSPEGIPGEKTMVSINTPDGTWRLFASVAILIPHNMARSQSTVPGGFAPAKDELAMRRTAELDKLTIWSGERVQKGDQHLIRVRSVLTDEGSKLLRVFAKEAIAAHQNEIPGAARLALTLMGPTLMDANLPVCTEHVIDADTNVLLSRRSYASSGKLLHELKPGSRPSPPFSKIERVVDWPMEFFEPPPQLERIRARTFAEGQRLANERMLAEHPARSPAAPAVSDEPDSAGKEKGP